MQEGKTQCKETCLNALKSFRGICIDGSVAMCLFSNKATKRNVYSETLL